MARATGGKTQKYVEKNQARTGLEPAILRIPMTENQALRGAAAHRKWPLGGPWLGGRAMSNAYKPDSATYSG